MTPRRKTEWQDVEVETLLRLLSQTRPGQFKYRRFRRVGRRRRAGAGRSQHQRLGAQPSDRGHQ